MSRNTSNQRRGLSAILAVAFAVAMLMGVGPGVLLVNRPETFLGIPLLYAWGLFWYAVHIVIVVTAYCCLWQGTPADDGKLVDANGGKRDNA